MSDHPDKSYLGDGAYIQLGSFHGEVLITTEDGVSVQNTVVLDESGLRSLVAYVQEHGIQVAGIEDNTQQMEAPSHD